jgi:FG-GAP-like repeat/Abnormal spindle-like microcephaly-assoc'd, ASPM-SPD-2-Hydin
MKRSHPFVALRGRFLVRLSVLGVFLVSVAHGQVSFLTPPTYSAGGQDFVADYNGDGKPDILSGSVMNLGNGDGTFTKGAPVTGTPLAVADFNGDGKPDVLEQGQGTLEVLLGNGDGTFQTTPIITNIEASLRGVIAGDLRGDGKSDVLGFSNNELIVYLGNGDGTFAAGVSYPVVGPVVATLGDFNGDHKLDVVVSVAGDNGIVPGQEVVFLGNGDGTFQAGRISTGVPNPASAVVGDFNSDGKLDLVISNQSLGCNSPCPTSILLGNGDGTFQAPTAIFPGTGSLAVGDVNGDGKLDLVFLDEFVLVEVHLGNGDGTFSNTHSYQTQFSGGNDGPVLADFNLDGKLDIAATGTSLLGNGDGSFKGWSAIAGAGPVYNVSLRQVAVGDFDKNGTQDLAVCPPLAGTQLYIFTNDGTGALSLAHTYTLQAAGSGIATADLNGDGNLDLVVVGSDPVSGNWAYSVLLGNGDGSFQPPVYYPQSIGGIGSSIVIADFNGDHKPDFAVPAGDQTLAVLLGNGDGTFGMPTYIFDKGASSIVAADFNGDGKLDIAASGVGLLQQGMVLLLGNGDGTFQPATYPFSDTCGGLLTADLNLDRNADLVDYCSHVYLGNGHGTFKEVTASGYIVTALADINGDGVPDEIGDQAISKNQFGMGLALGNGDGTFGSFEAVFDDFTLFPELAADMNGDGKQDLIVVPGNTIFVLINTTVSVAGASFSPASVTFPSQTVGTSSSPIPVTLTNTGAVALTVTGVTLGGADAGEFSQTNNCTKVEPSANCTIKVQFAPTAAGASTANLMVADNAAGSPQAVPLSGTGIAAPDFTIGPAAGSKNSETITAGQAASFSLAITPSGSFSGTVNLTCAVTPVATPAPVCQVPASVNVTAGTVAPVSVTVSTTAPMIAGAMASTNFPSGANSAGWTLAMLASGLLLAGYRRRMPALAVALIAVAFLALPGCGGGGGSSPPPPGTPAGSYTTTVTATAGNLKHTTALTVIVH